MNERPSSSILAEEVAFFESRKPDLLKTNKGQFALVKGKELYGTFTTFQEAYKASIVRFGNAAVLIRQITEQEPVHRIPALTYGLSRAAI